MICTSCKNLVNFGTVTPQFKKVKDVHSVVSFFKIDLSDKLSQDPLDQFSPHGRYLIVDCWSDPLIQIPQGTLPWQPILRLQMDEIGRLTFIRRLGIPKQIAVLHFWF